MVFFMQVKDLLSDGAADRDGRIKRGDCILSVNGHSLIDVSKYEALKMLKEAGSHVTLVLNRIIGNWTSRTLHHMPPSHHSRRQESAHTSSTRNESYSHQRARRIFSRDSPKEGVLEKHRREVNPVTDHTKKHRRKSEASPGKYTTSNNIDSVRTDNSDQHDTKMYRERHPVASKDNDVDNGHTSSSLDKQDTKRLESHSMTSTLKDSDNMHTSSSDKQDYPNPMTSKLKDSDDMHTSSQDTRRLRYSDDMHTSSSDKQDTRRLQYSMTSKLKDSDNVHTTSSSDKQDTKRLRYPNPMTSKLKDNNDMPTRSSLDKQDTTKRLMASKDFRNANPEPNSQHRSEYPIDGKHTTSRDIRSAHPPASGSNEHQQTSRGKSPTTVLEIKSNTQTDDFDSNKQQRSETCREISSTSTRDITSTCTQNSDFESKPTSIDYSHIESWRMSLPWSPESSNTAGTSADGLRNRRPLTPLRTPKHQRDSGKVLTFKNNKSTLPRVIRGNKRGVCLVELEKGPAWLGMQLQGGGDVTPITVRAVFRGGTVYKSGKIHVGDEIIEVNGVPLAKLRLEEAVKVLRDLPPGKVSLILRNQEESTRVGNC